MEFEELYKKLVIAIAGNYRANELNGEVNERICRKALDVAVQAHKTWSEYKYNK